MPSIAAIEKILKPDVPKRGFGLRRQRLVDEVRNSREVPDTTRDCIDLIDDMFDYKLELDSRLHGAIELIGDMAQLLPGIFSFSLDQRREIEDWCDEQLTGPFTITVIERNYNTGFALIRDDTDAVKYKLRWGGD